MNLSFFFNLKCFSLDQNQQQFVLSQNQTVTLITYILITKEDKMTLTLIQKGGAVQTLLGKVLICPMRIFTFSFGGIPTLKFVFCILPVLVHTISNTLSPFCSCRHHGHQLTRAHYTPRSRTEIAQQSWVCFCFGFFVGFFYACALNPVLDWGQGTHHLIELYS